MLSVTLSWNQRAWQPLLTAAIQLQNLSCPLPADGYLMSTWFYFKSYWMNKFMFMRILFLMCLINLFFFKLEDQFIKVWGENYRDGKM